MHLLRARSQVSSCPGPVPTQWCSGRSFLRCTSWTWMTRETKMQARTCRWFASRIRNRCSEEAEKGKQLRNDTGNTGRERVDGCSSPPIRYNKQRNTMTNILRTIKDMIPGCKKTLPRLVLTSQDAVIGCIFQSQLMSCLSYNEKSWMRSQNGRKITAITAQAHRHKIAARANESY